MYFFSLGNILGFVWSFSELKTSQSRGFIVKRSRVTLKRSRLSDISDTSDT